MNLKMQFIAALTLASLSLSASVNAATPTANVSTQQKATPVTTALNNWLTRLLSTNTSATQMTQKSSQIKTSCDAKDRSRTCEVAPPPRLTSPPPNEFGIQPCTGRQCPDTLEPIEGDI